MQNFNYQIKIFIVIAVLFCACSAYSFDGARKHFYSHGPSVAVFAAGETLFSQRNDPSVIQYNPALQALFSDNAVSLARFNLFEGSSYNSASASMNLFGRSFFGLSVSNLSSGDIEIRQNIYDPPSVISINSWNFLLSHGGFINFLKMSYGINLKYFYQDLYFKTAGAYDVDLGMAKILNAGNNTKVKLALSAQNILNSKIKADIYAEELPRIFRFASAVVIPTVYRFNSKDEVSIFADIVLEDALFDYHLGASYLFSGKYAVRAGYYKGHITAGFGADIYSFTLDYSADFSEVGLINRFGLTYRWGIAGDALEKEARAALEKESEKFKRAENNFNLAKKHYALDEMLTAADILSELIVSYPGFEAPQEFYNRINQKMRYEAQEIGAVDFAKLSYAKAFIAYYGGDFNQALMEWRKFTAFTGGTYEVSKYSGKISDALKLEELQKRDAELSQQAQKMLDAGIEQFNQSKWILCIKNMESLQKWTAQNTFSGSVDFYTKAKEYIDAAVTELAKTIRPAKSSEPVEIKENNVEIDLEGADEKYNEGLVFYAQGKYLEAQRAWEITLRLNPNHIKAKVALEKIKNKS